MSKYHILIIDPDKDFCFFLQKNLTTEGYEVDVAQSARDIQDTVYAQYDLVVMETNLHEISGFRLAHKLRNQAQTSLLPLILISSNPGENELTTAFSVGADDFLLKPFFVRELAARIKVIIRRLENKKLQNVESIEYEDLKLNLANMQVKLGNKTIPFTKKEFEILKLLMENKNQLIKRDELLKLVWKDKEYVMGRTIDVNITRIRQKIGAYCKNIVTKVGLGYSFEG